MPNALTNNKVIESFQSSWNKTKQLGLKGFVAFMIVLGIYQALLHMPGFLVRYLPFEDSLLSAVVYLTYSNLLLILAALMNVAAWYQVHESKERLLEYEYEETIILE